jgi:predicted CoA-binding protein
VAKFDGLKVFSATLNHERAVLGEKVTEWIASEKDNVDIVDIEVFQSSDAAFHCVTIIVYYKRKVAHLVGRAGKRS